MKVSRKVRRVEFIYFSLVCGEVHPLRRQIATTATFPTPTDRNSKNRYVLIIFKVAVNPLQIGDINIGNTNPVKFGRCIKELERIYGVRNGGDRKSDGKYSQLKTQSDLADELGIDVKTLSNYKALANAIPEIQSLIETGIVTPTTARAISGEIRTVAQDAQNRPL